MAIKGIGWGAINGMVEERRTNGPFQDFEDFCRRMSGKDLNRRAVENLIRAGAFDSMGYKRKALLQIADLVISSISQAEKENIAGQMDLFGEDDMGAAVGAGITIPDVEEFSPREKMSMEKETTGLYLTGHPMDEYRDAVRRIGAVPIGAVLNDFAAEDGPHSFQDNQYVTLAGVVESARTRATKNNTLMSYIQLEDDSGTMELIAFQKALDEGGSYLAANAAIIVRGRISVRDEKEPQLMVDSIRPISDLGSLGTPPSGQSAAGRNAPPRQGAASPIAQPGQKLWVKLPSRFDPAMKRIELILTMFPGEQQMILWCEREQKRIGAKCLIHEGLILELQELLGKENVIVK